MKESVLMGGSRKCRFEDTSVDSACSAIGTISDKFWATRRCRQRQTNKEPRGCQKKALPDRFYLNSFPTKGPHQAAIRRREKYQPDRKNRKTALDHSGENRERKRCAGICGGPAREILRNAGRCSDRSHSIRQEWERWRPARLQNADGRRRDSSEEWELSSGYGTAKASGPAARQRTGSDKDDSNGNSEVRSGATSNFSQSRWKRKKPKKRFEGT